MEQFEVLNDVAGGLLAVERNYSKVRSPSFKFSHPVCDSGIWDNYKSRESIPIRGNISQESHDLYRLSLHNKICQIRYQECGL